MDVIVDKVCQILDVLGNQVIATWNNNDVTYTEGMGWMGSSISSQNLAEFAYDLAADLRITELNADQLKVLALFETRLVNLQNSVVAQMSGTNVGQAIPAYVNTILYMRLKFLPRLPCKPLDWQNVDDAKQLPSNIVKRAVAADNILNEYEPHISEISEKINKK